MIIHHLISVILRFIVILTLIIYLYKEFLNFHYYIHKLTIPNDLFNFKLYNTMKVIHLQLYYKNYLMIKQQEEAL